MGKVKVEDGKLCFRKMLRPQEVSLADQVWAYLQQEDASAKMCCGRMSVTIGRVILWSKDGQKQMFQFEGMEEAKDLLARIQEAAPQIAIGYTEENRRKFGFVPVEAKAAE